MGLTGTTANTTDNSANNTNNNHHYPTLPTISAKISPAQIQVLQSTATGSHPTLANHQPLSHTFEPSGDNNGNSSSSGPSVNLPSNSSELRFTENIVTLPPAFGKLLSNLKVKPGTATVSASETAQANMDPQQQQQQGSSGADSKFSTAFVSGKMDQAVTLVKEMPSRMGSWAAFFDPKQFSMPSSNLKERLKGNLGGFYANYVVVSVILLTYCLLTSPMLLMGVIIYGLLAYVIINRGQDLSIMGQAVTPNQQLFCLTLIFMPIFLLLGFTGVFFWLIGASSCLIALHATFHEWPLKSSTHDDLEAAENGHVGFTGDVPHEVHRSNGPVGGPAFQVVNL